MFAALRGAQPAETGVLGRIGQWLAAPRRLAVAASLLIAAAVSIRMIGGGGGQQPVVPSGSGTVQPQGGHLVDATPSRPPTAPRMDIKGPGDLLPPGVILDRTAVANVEIGPPAGGAPTIIAEDGTSRPSRASVASDKSGVKDKDAKAQRDSGWFFPR